jgi:hypothetical protein
MEPYWHPVRLEQVIGRARRICSHKNLPSALQTVEVFVYLKGPTQYLQIDSDGIFQSKERIHYLNSFFISNIFLL